MLSIKKLEDPKYLFICVTGMPGSGKSLIANIIKHLADTVISMGDVIRREAIKRGIIPTPKTLMELAKNIRKEYGLNYVAVEVIKEVMKKNANIVVIDGVRSLDEIKTFREYGEVFIVAVHSSPKVRFLRLSTRGREGDPKDWYEFTQRDLDELELGVGSVMALADLMIVNEDLSIDDLTNYVLSKVRGFIRR